MSNKLAVAQAAYDEAEAAVIAILRKRGHKMEQGRRLLEVGDQVPPCEMDFCTINGVDLPMYAEFPAKTAKYPERPRIGVGHRMNKTLFHQRQGRFDCEGIATAIEQYLEDQRKLGEARNRTRTRIAANVDTLHEVVAAYWPTAELNPGQECCITKDIAVLTSSEGFLLNIKHAITDNQLRLILNACVEGGVISEKVP